MMTDLEYLRDLLAERFPEARLDLDAPGQPTGSGWLDLRFNGYHVVVEWRPGRGFGLSSSPSAYDYGGGPDEICETVSGAFDRLKALVLGRLATAQVV